MGADELFNAWRTRKQQEVAGTIRPDPLVEEPPMDVFRRAMHVVSDAVEAGVAAAGAAGGAAVNGVVGGVLGAAEGAQKGLSSGSRSLSAAALTVAAVGTVGLVEWPVLLPVGATILGVHYLTNRSGGQRRRTSSRRVGSRPAAKNRSASRGAARGTAARSRPARSAQ